MQFKIFISADVQFSKITSCLNIFKKASFTNEPTKCILNDFIFKQNVKLYICICNFTASLTLSPKK